MTVGVYGLVASIVKLDDAGFHLAAKTGKAPRACGRLIVAAAPKLMKGLSALGTAAMFLVGGGIIAHGTPGLSALAHKLPGGSLMSALIDGAVGLVAGAVILSLTKAWPHRSGR
jgi:predicted DNA repair protein MutK